MYAFVGVGNKVMIVRVGIDEVDIKVGIPVVAIVGTQKLSQDCWSLMPPLSKLYVARGPHQGASRATCGPLAGRCPGVIRLMSQYTQYLVGIRHQSRSQFR